MGIKPKCYTKQKIKQHYFFGNIKTKDNPNSIKEKIDILDDFDKAMRVGHGQFSWASADYLNNEQSNERYQELFTLALNAPMSDQNSKANSESS